MIVALAGADGKVAMRLTTLLSRAGDEVIGLIRNPDHTADVERQGASPVVCDLEQATVEEITAAITGADGRCSPPGPGPEAGPNAS
jgi:nucleoside-diphosphate-sugar epimerase